MWQNLAILLILNNLCFICPVSLYSVFTAITHVARHTFATYLLNKGIPIETVSRALGHSTLGMTQHYAKLLGKKVVDDMSVLLG